MSRNHNENTSDVEKEDEYGGFDAMLNTVQRAGQAQAAVNKIVQNYADDKPIHCHYCGRPAEDVVPQDWETKGIWSQDYESASDWVRGEEGTFNAELWTFCCDACYFDIGMPSAPGGWMAGQ
jgi:hypothetical protein